MITDFGRQISLEYGALQKELLTCPMAINTMAAAFSEVQLLYIAGASLRHKHLTLRPEAE